MLDSRISQFHAVCQGVSVNALTESPTLTEVHHIVQATDIYHISPFSIAQAVPDHQEEG